ncbi:MAG: UvrD-helicase domain-containing protein, partial [FCB group bacterium]|nr:UvrD-helicase domain-containing protein [FCB group bacterium]
SLIPLPEILSELLSCGPATKKVMSLYEKLLFDLGPELTILMETPLHHIEAAGGPLLKEAVDRMRQRKVIREGGYDGEYGVIRLFEDREKEAMAGQMALFKAPSRKAQKKSADPRPAPKRKASGKKSASKTKGPISPKDPILDPLNPEQKAAVRHEGPHLLVKAGPGTGKTMTLTHCIAHVIRQGLAPPGEVLALTFTRKAAREMEQRISRLLTEASLPFVSTFHGFCLEVLRKEGGKIGLPRDFLLCSEADTKALAKDIFEKSGAGKGVVRPFLKALPALKRASVLGPDGNVAEKEFSSLFRDHSQGLRNLGMLDLDDLEVEALRLFRHDPDTAGDWGRKFPWIFVDEYQDTNALQ